MAKPTEQIEPRKKEPFHIVINIVLGVIAILMCLCGAYQLGLI